ncbi:MAG: hypothetical protein K2X48_00695 [Chitinophagaceae bacterium]|nr:hypothetical protein [Chitinophagaceae bacterium]
MKQKLLLLTITFLLLGSVSFHESIACDSSQKKDTVSRKTETAKKKTAKAESIPFDMFPFAHSILMN